MIFIKNHYFGGNFFAQKRISQKLAGFQKVEEVWPLLKLKISGGLNSTIIEIDSVKKKTQFFDFLANYQSEIPDTIMISEKNPLAQ